MKINKITEKQYRKPINPKAGFLKRSKTVITFETNWSRNKKKIHRLPILRMKGHR